MSAVHGLAPPSPWLLRWAHLLQPGQQALDLACGSGRHVHWLAARGLQVAAVDRDAAALTGLAGLADTLAADIEAGPWPLGDRQFDLVLVTNYLWRPLWPRILAALAPGGLLVYETFAQGNETVGRPARPEFLLAPGELLAVCAGLRIVGYEDGFVEAPPRFVQRIAALRPDPGLALPWRIPLPG